MSNHKVIYDSSVVSQGHRIGPSGWRDIRMADHVTDLEPITLGEYLKRQEANDEAE